MTPIIRIPNSGRWRDRAAWSALGVAVALTRRLAVAAWIAAEALDLRASRIRARVSHPAGAHLPGRWGR